MQKEVWHGLEATMCFTDAEPRVSQTSLKFVTQTYRHRSLIQSVLLQAQTGSDSITAIKKIRPVWHYDTIGKNKPGKLPLTPAPE